MSQIDTPAHVAMAEALWHPVADKAKVTVLVEEWRKAFEFAVNHPEDGRQFGYIDAFMALVNLSRLILEDIETRAKFGKPEKWGFRMLFLNTMERSLFKRLEKE